MSRFSSTLSSRSLVIACGMTPIERRTPSARLTTSKPLMSAVPEVGGSSVVSMRISVDLPAPFGPSRPKISPFVDVEADALDGGEVAELLDDVPDVDGVASMQGSLRPAAARTPSCRPPAGGRGCRRAGGLRTS